MGVAGWRFAHVKRNLSGRAAIVAVLQDWQVICSAVVAAGSMIMLGIMLYRDWPHEYDAAQERGEVAKHGGGVPDGNVEPSAEDVGLTREQIHEARKIRDAEERETKEGP